MGFCALTALRYEQKSNFDSEIACVYIMQIDGRRLWFRTIWQAYQAIMRALGLLPAAAEGGTEGGAEEEDAAAPTAVPMEEEGEEGESPLRLWSCIARENLTFRVEPVDLHGNLYVKIRVCM